MIFDYFDGAYYINLESRPDRREAFERRSQEVGLTVERFSAIQPPEMVFGRPVDIRERAKLGCTLSHFGVYELAQQRQQTTVLVFEDDCTFVDGFAQKMVVYIEELCIQQDWDLLYLGGSPEPDYGVPGRKCERISPHLIYNPGWIWGAHAYAIHSRFIPKILATNRYQNYPADINLSGYSSGLRRYLMTDELLTFQDDDSPSDLWGGVIPRTQIFL